MTSSKDNCYQEQYSCKRLIAANISTQCIKYKPRVIKIPSPGFPDINEALKKVKERRGGYILKLSPGIHIITKDCYGHVDDLEVMGDCNPFAGMGYFVGMKDEDILVLSNLGILGQGPFTMIAEGNRITVKGVKNPNFDIFSKERRAATFVNKCDGTLKQVLIVGGEKNDIFFDQNIGSGILSTGEGFYINPNVVLKFQSNNQQLIIKNNLHLQGLVINSSLFSLGSLGGFFSMCNCVVTKGSFLIIRGNYRFLGPNAFASIVYLPAGTIGTSQNFFIVGQSSRLEADTSSGNSWSNGFFISSSLGARIMNGSSIALAKNQFIFNCIGLFVAFGSSATIYGSLFDSNKFGIIAYYNSTVSNATNNTLSAYYPPPIFRANVYPTAVGHGSYIIIPKAGFVDNVNHTVIEGHLYVTAPPVGVMNGTSMVLELPNPFDILPSDTSCTGGDNTSLLFASSYQGVQGIKGIVTKDVLNNTLLPNSIASTVTATPSGIPNAGSGSIPSAIPGSSIPVTPGANIGSGAGGGTCAGGTCTGGVCLGNPAASASLVKIIDSTGKVTPYNKLGYVP